MKQDLMRVDIIQEIFTGFRFDLARLDIDHLREIYMDHAKTAITIPLYLVTFGLHQATAKTDDQLLLILYYSGNETTRSNVREYHKIQQRITKIISI